MQLRVSLTKCPKAVKGSNRKVPSCSRGARFNLAWLRSFKVRAKPQDFLVNSFPQAGGEDAGGAEGTARAGSDEGAWQWKLLDRAGCYGKNFTAGTNELVHVSTPLPRGPSRPTTFLPAWYLQTCGQAGFSLDFTIVRKVLGAVKQDCG